MLACIAALAVGTAAPGGADVRVRLVEEGRGAHLTPGTLAYSDPSGNGVVLRSPDGSTRHLNSRSVHFSGGSLLTLEATGGGTEAVVLDPTGRFLRRAPLDSGAKAIAFGSSLVVYRPATHEPGLPYDLNLVGGSGGKRIARAGRTIVDLRPIEQYLMVASTRDGEAFPIEIELLAASGEPRWTMTTDRIATRAVVDGDRAVALSSDRRGSVLRLFGEGDEPDTVLEFDGRVLTDAAFVEGGPGLLAWGRRHAVLVDAGIGRAIWSAELPAGEQLLSNGTSFAASVGGVIAMASRRELPDEGWAASLLLLDLEDGRVTESIPLRRQAGMPTWTRRYVSASGEQLVFAEGVYRISAVPGSRP